MKATRQGAKANRKPGICSLACADSGTTQAYAGIGVSDRSPRPSSDGYRKKRGNVVIQNLVQNFLLAYLAEPPTRMLSSTLIFDMCSTSEAAVLQLVCRPNLPQPTNATRAQIVINARARKFAVYNQTQRKRPPPPNDFTKVNCFCCRERDEPRRWCRERQRRQSLRRQSSGRHR